MKIPTVSPSFTLYGLFNGAWRPTLLFPPQQRKIWHEAVLNEILEERVSSSRSRVVPRGVKRKMSNYRLRPRKRLRTHHLKVAWKIRILK